MSTLFFSALLCVLLELYLTEIICGTISQKKTHSAWRIRLIWGIAALILLLPHLPPLSALLPYETGFVLLGVLTASLCYALRWTWRLCFMAFFLLLWGAAELLAGLLMAAAAGLTFSQFAARLTPGDAVYQLGRVISLFLALLLTKLISVPLKKRKMPETSQLSILSLALPVVSCIIVLFFSQTMLLANSQGLVNLILLLYTLLFLVNVFFVALLERLAEAKAAERERDITYAELRQEIDHYRQLLLQRQDAAQAMAEVQNQLEAGLALLRDGKAAEAGALLDKAIAGTERRDRADQTGNIVVDAILDAKWKRMQDLGIVFTHNIIIPPDCSISHGDLAVVVGNILDNAINACEKVEGRRYIRFTAKLFHAYLCFRMENSASPVPESEHDGDYSLHGFGLRNVRQAAEKYNGNVTIEREADRFTITVLLLDERKEGEP